MFYGLNLLPSEYNIVLDLKEKIIFKSVFKIKCLIWRSAMYMWLECPRKDLRHGFYNDLARGSKTKRKAEN